MPASKVELPSAQELQLAQQGAGALLQRDYWAAIAECRAGPAQIMDDVRRRFAEFPPEDLVSFARVGPRDQALREGDELDIVIRMAGACRVRVSHCCEQSVTFATLQGHPEAGRITFGAYAHESGAVIFHIRSRSRSGNPRFAAGFWTIGEAMQTNTWTDFVRTVANTHGAGVLGELHADTSEVELVDDDQHATHPTFDAIGGDG